MSKPEIKITSRKQNLNKNEKNKTPINSNFLITLNLNQQYHKDEHIQNIDNDMDVFDDYINEMLNNIEQYLKLPEGVEYNDDNIKDISADYVVEVGNIKKQIHAHLMVKFTTSHKNSIKFWKN